MNEKLKAEYEEVTGKPFVRSQLQPLEAVPVGVILKIVFILFAAGVIVFGVIAALT